MAKMKLDKSSQKEIVFAFNVFDIINTLFEEHPDCVVDKSDWDYLKKGVERKLKESNIFDKNEHFQVKENETKAFQ